MNDQSEQRSLSYLLRHSEPLNSEPADTADIPPELVWICQQTNGLTLPNRELILRPADRTENGLAAWNSPQGWTSSFDLDLSPYYFFGENIFGEQFAISEGNYYTFDPFAGTFDHVGTTLEDWASWLIGNFNTATGYPLAAQWAKTHGFTDQYGRLAQKIPFILGGQYDITNLYEAHSADILDFAATIYNQIKDLPDGTAIKLEVT